MLQQQNAFRKKWLLIATSLHYVSGRQARGVLEFRMTCSEWRGLAGRINGWAWGNLKKKIDEKKEQANAPITQIAIVRIGNNGHEKGIALAARWRKFG